MKSLETLLSNLYTGDNKLKILDQRYLPRWIVVIIDVFLCVFSLALVYLIMLGTPVFFSDEISFPAQAMLLIGVNVSFFILFKTYSGIIRHSTFTDILKLAFSSSATAVLLITFNVIYFLITGHKVYTLALLLLYMFLSFTMLLLFRVAVKEIYQLIKKGAKGILKKRVAIIGSDDQTVALAKALTTESNLPFKLVGFLTENFVSNKFKLLGKPVIPIKNNLPEIINNYNIEGVIIISESISVKEKKRIVDECLENDIEVFNVPFLEQWNSKADMRSQIKPIQIEDLLERDSIAIEDKAIKENLENKIILVTGGAGSIGSEIVRQIALYSPKLLVVLDQAESALHELELDLIEKFPDLKFITELANISNMYRLEQLFTKYQFNVVYHAAAYKHVPLIERNPHEAIFVNILGTVNLAVLAVSHKIDKFVMISTDKAVNPTNVMGASKRVAEMYVQSLQKKSPYIRVL